MLQNTLSALLAHLGSLSPFTRRLVQTLFQQFKRSLLRRLGRLA